MRKLLFVALLGLTLALFAGSANAYTIQGGDAAHRGAVDSLLRSRPGITQYVESVWPDFQVRIGYGEHAFPGYMWVDGRKWGTDYSRWIAHELGHMVQLAADAEGDYPSIGGDWLDLLTTKSKGPDLWVWTHGPPYFGRNNPWEAFAENVARAYYAPYYTGRATPNTNLAWLSRAEMTAFLQAHGVQP